MVSLKNKCINAKTDIPGAPTRQGTYRGATLCTRGPGGRWCWAGAWCSGARSGLPAAPGAAGWSRPASSGTPRPLRGQHTLQRPPRVPPGAATGAVCSEALGGTDSSPQTRPPPRSAALKPAQWWMVVSGTMGTASLDCRARQRSH